MKNHSLAIISLLLSFIILVSFPITASAVGTDGTSVGVTSGMSGDCTWTLDDNGKLTISGNGKTGFMDSPWGKEIKELVVEDGVTGIGDNAFNSCTQLSKVTLCSTLSDIGRASFAGCTGLSEIMIPAGVKYIAEYAFGYCDNLTTMRVDENNPVFDSRNNCNAIIDTKKNMLISGCKSSVIPDGIIRIEAHAFYGCKANEIAVPDSVISIGTGAFEESTWYNNQPGGMVYAGKVAYKYKSTIPADISVVLKDGTLGIAEYAFIGCKDIVSIQIPESVINIDKGAFSGCSGLTHINIPDAVSVIGNFSFYKCTSLTLLKLPAQATRIGESAFEKCSGLERIDIPDLVTEICERAFYQCSGLCSITFGEGVETIGATAFCGCSSLSAVQLPDRLKRIDYDAFKGCTAISDVQVGDCIEIMGPTVFYNTLWYDSQPDGLIYLNNVLYKMKGDIPQGSTVTVKDGTRCIASEAFYKCGYEFSLSLPDSLQFINYNAFYYCGGLKSLQLPSGVIQIAFGAFLGSINLTELTIPDNITSIGSAAFFDCCSLHSVTIPQSVVTLGRESFGYYYEGNSSTKLNDFTIKGYAGSAAERYALENGFTFINISTKCKSLQECSVTLDQTIFTYDGSAKTPSVIATDGLKQLVQNTDYTVEYYRNTGIGVAYAIVTGKGEYQDSVICQFSIKAVETQPPTAPDSPGRFLVESVPGKTGETVDVNIRIEDNPGITSLQIKVGYSSADLELTEIYDNSLFDSPISHGKLTSNPVKISWFSGLSDDNDENGTIATLRFRIKPGAKDSTVTLSYDQANVFSISGREVSFAIFDGTVAVDNTKTLSSIAVSKMPTKTVYEIGESLDTKGLQLKLIYSDGSVSYATSGFNTSGFNSASEGAKMVTVNYQGKTVSFEVTVNPQAEQPTCSDDSPKFLVGSATGKPGETVDIKVSIENNPSITALQVKIGYSSEDLELTEIIDNSLFDSPISHSKYLTANPQTISWHSTNSDDLSDNGTFVTLRFKLKPGAKDSSVTLSYKKSNVFNSSFDEFDFQVVNGMVYVMNSAIMLGDVDGDGNVEIRDATWIQRHVALMEIPIEAHKATADVDGDGEITLMDATSIQRYLANLKSNDKIGKLLAG